MAVVYMVVTLKDMILYIVNPEEKKRFILNIYVHVFKSQSESEFIFVCFFLISPCMEQQQAFKEGSGYSSRWLIHAADYFEP